MKFFHLSILFIMVFLFYGTAQELVYELDFEDQTVGTEITKRNTLQFQGWNKSVWTVGQEEDNKVAASTAQAKVFLIKSFDVTPGNRYRWSLETKAVNNGPAWKRTHVLSVVCGKGDESQQLAKENIGEPKNGTWASSSLDFTVPQNKSEVTLQLFRFADGTTVSVDNYKIVKF
jgi:hypothetical protein